jgi:hypothetical protein
VSDLKFVELPEATRHDARWDELAAYPGQWAEWWGATSAHSVYQACATANRRHYCKGITFRGRTVNHKQYVAAFQMKDGGK